jgi:aminoglycoside phosphotransferase
MDSDLLLLTGEDAGELLSAALATTGGVLHGWRPTQVDHRPGASTTVLYSAQVRWGGPTTTRLLAASVGDARVGPDVPGVLALSDGDRQVAVWAVPTDPDLPGLARATDPVQLAELLAPFLPSDVRPSDLQHRLRVYRPRRRALVQVGDGRTTFYLKVLPPSAAPDVARRHAMLTGAGLPVPEAVRAEPDGIVVLTEIPGDPVRRPIVQGGPVPSGAAVAALLQRLPDEVRQLPQRRPWAAHARHYAAVIGAALPQAAAQAEDLAAVLSAELDGMPPDAPTHGDFYEAQIFARNGRITGLLDLDTLGPGRRADDFGCLLAHLAVLQDRAGAARVTALTTDWLGAADACCDPREVRLRTAAVLLSLATGPHRVQEAGWQDATLDRLALAEHWWRGA